MPCSQVDLNNLLERSETLLTFYILLVIWLWRWRQYFPSKRQWTSTVLYVVTSKKIEVFIVTAVRNSDPKLYTFARNILYHECSQEKLIFNVFRTSTLGSEVNKQITATIYTRIVSFLLCFDYDLCVLMCRDSVSFTTVIIWFPGSALCLLCLYKLTPPFV